MGVLEILLWLALNNFREAAYEPMGGQVAVAETVLERSDICGESVMETITKPKQFSWVPYDGEIKAPDVCNPDVLDLFLNSFRAATVAYCTASIDGSPTYYHRFDISPAWAKDKNSIGRIPPDVGSHIFYSGRVDSCSKNKIVKIVPGTKRKVAVAGSITSVDESAKVASTRKKIDNVRARIDERG